MQIPQGLARRPLAGSRARQQGSSKPVLHGYPDIYIYICIYIYIHILRMSHCTVWHHVVPKRVQVAASPKLPFKEPQITSNGRPSGPSARQVAVGVGTLQPWCWPTPLRREQFGPESKLESLYENKRGGWGSCERETGRGIDMIVDRSSYVEEHKP